MDEYEDIDEREPLQLPEDHEEIKEIKDLKTLTINQISNIIRTNKSPK